MQTTCPMINCTGSSCKMRRTVSLNPVSNHNVGCTYMYMYIFVSNHSCRSRRRRRCTQDCVACCCLRTSVCRHRTSTPWRSCMKRTSRRSCAELQVACPTSFLVHNVLTCTRHTFTCASYIHVHVHVNADCFFTCAEESTSVLEVDCGKRLSQLQYEIQVY